MLRHGIALTVVALMLMSAGCAQKQRRLRAMPNAKVTAPAAALRLDDEPEDKSKSKLSKAAKAAGKVYVNGWDGLEDESSKNGKWSVADKAN